MGMCGLERRADCHSSASQTLKSDEGAHFDRIVKISSADIAPTVTWGTSPQDVAPITGVVPNPKDAKTPDRQAAMERALVYMDLVAGIPLEEVKINKVCILDAATSSAC